MSKQVSTTHASFSPQGCRPFMLDKDYSMDEVDQLLPQIGVSFGQGVIDRMMDNYGMDAIQQPLTTASITTPLQFLQEWLPGFVSMVTAARKIDSLIGISTVGAWEDEQIVQQVMEMSGSPVPYGDTTVTPLSDWNLNFVQRTVVRFEQGMRVGELEQRRAARVRISSDAQKRAGAALALEIQRNALGFYGYNSGLNLTYGFLNDPNLPNYVTVATVGGHTTWIDKTADEIYGDILTGLQALRTNSNGVIDPSKDPITLAIATNRRDYMNKTNVYGLSVVDLLNKAYSNVRIEDAPQLNTASSSLPVFYLWADSINDGLSTDDARTFIQVVPAKFMLLGNMKLTKGYEEAYSNASAGVLNKRPFAVYRANGI